jgi:4-hydroxybenzoate polyprenyltransferase
MAHRLASRDLLLNAGLAFLAFSLCASASYILNDWRDIARDRAHPRKRHRPLASGEVSVPAASLLAFFLLAGAGGLTLLLPRDFAWILSLYVFFSAFYSLALKRVVLMDVMVLAFFYALRIFAGAVAIGVPVSSWLLAFSIFIFFSLALLKRYSELAVLSKEEGTLTGRGYRKGDLDALAMLGTASGFLSVLVLALYVSGDEVTALYSHPRALWLLCPVMLYWVSRVWLLAHRGGIPDEPIVFALKDGASYAAGILAGIIVWMAS